MTSQKTIAIIAPLGIGNTVLVIPTLKACKRFLPDYGITVVVFTRQGKEILEYCPYIDSVVSFPDIPTKGPMLILKQLLFLYGLRKKRFDISLTAFPTNHALYNLIAWAIHAKIRISHQYLVKRVTSLSFLQTIKVAVEQCHDVEQNLNLLLPLFQGYGGLSPLVDSPLRRKPSLELWIPQELRAQAERLITPYAASGEEFLIGMSAGSSQARKMALKRWLPEKFALLARKFLENYPTARVFLFGGKEEESLNQEIAEAIEHRVIVIQGGSILETASIIERMSLFICNDSGLMHIAVSVGVPTVAIFGPTDATRTAPYGDRHRVVRQDLECSPCWPLLKVGERRRCPYVSPVCLTELSVSAVFRAARETLASCINVSGGS
jgi:ADP-heptose:LPS heptosyltransferase